MGNSYLRISAVGEQSERHSPGQKVMSAFESFVARRAEILPEDTFHTMLTLERRRAERSRQPFVLMLLDAGEFGEGGAADRFMAQVMSVLFKSTRETALVGWVMSGLLPRVMSSEFGTWL